MGFILSRIAVAVHLESVDVNMNMGSYVDVRSAI